MKKYAYFSPYLGFSGLRKSEYDVFTLCVKWGVSGVWLYSAIRSGFLKADRTCRPMIISHEDAKRFQRDHLLPMLDEQTFIRDNMDDFGGLRRSPEELATIRAACMAE